MDGNAIPRYLLTTARCSLCTVAGLGSGLLITTLALDWSRSAAALRGDNTLASGYRIFEGLGILLPCLLLTVALIGGGLAGGLVLPHSRRLDRLILLLGAALVGALAGIGHPQTCLIAIALVLAAIALPRRWYARRGRAPIGFEGSLV